MSNILEIEDVSISYGITAGEVKAIRNVSLSLERGSSLGILGESGCGKTTLALSLLGMLPDNAKVTGRVTFYPEENKSIELINRNENQWQKIRWSNISMIFQASMNSFSPVHKIGEQIVETIQEHHNVKEGEAYKAVEQLYGLVGIDKALINRYPHEYSGGMRQRAVIALSLACDPKIIIADEPTTALDVLVQFKILREIQKIQQDSQLTIIYISHDVGVVAQMCSKIAVFYAGALMEYGDVEDVLTKPIHPYTEELMNNTLSISGEPAKLKLSTSKMPSLIHLPEGCPYNTRCEYVQDICKTLPKYVVKNGTKAACHFPLSKSKAIVK